MENLKISDENRDEMALWKNLQKYPAWKRVVQILQKRIEQADLVINKVGGDRDKGYTQRDIAIIKKNSYLDLIEMPEKMIDQLKGTGTEPTENMDPFADNEDENEAELPNYEQDF